MSAHKNICIYDEFTEYVGKNGVSLVRVTEEMTHELLACYSDKSAVPFFNSDNCHGDDFYYTTAERMKKAMDFWEHSYKNRYFVRWAVKAENRIVGTIEMFHNETLDDFDEPYGVLRIDLNSKYENKEIIGSILNIADENFGKAFDVKYIVTKSFDNGAERTAALKASGYIPLGKLFRDLYEGYYFKKAGTK